MQMRLPHNIDTRIQSARGTQMKSAGVLTCLIACLGVAHANAECAYPKAPAAIPDGAQASEQEMMDGMKAVKQYDQDVNAYLACLDSEAQARIKEAGPDAPPEHIEQIKAIQSKRHNAAIEQLQAHAAEFNEQVRAFKSRKKS
jgi:hypothetical protein